MNKIFHKTVQFKATNVIQEERNGVPVGIIEGYASTYGIDRGNDQIMQGAFQKSLDRHAKDNRQIRMYYGHDSSKLIGGFPVSSAHEDSKGLFVKGEVNLQVQDGIEAYALAKQGVLADMSIGYSIPNKDSIKMVDFGSGKKIRQLKEVELWEISLVTEPMNKDAQIISVKGATEFGNLPLADRQREWDSGKAVARIRDFTGSVDAPSADYKKAFLWFDDSAPENFGSYKLPIADVEFNEMVAVPRAIFAAAGVMNGAMGGVDIPEADRSAVESHINRYYEKMNLESPIGKGIDITIVESCQKMKDVEELLEHLGISQKGSRMLIGKIKQQSLHCDGDVVVEGSDLQSKGSQLALAATGFLLTHTKG